MPKYLFLIFLSFILLGCGLNKAVMDPYSFGPEKPSAPWKPISLLSSLKTESYESHLPEDAIGKKLSLGELLNIALINNPETKKSWSEALASASAYGESQSSYLPQAEGNFSVNRTRSSFFDYTPSGAPDDFFAAYYLTTTTPELRLSYTLFDFGKRKYSTEKARQALFYADWMHNQNIQNVLQNVMFSYYSYQYQLAQVKALEANLENALTSLDAAEQKFHNGVASLGDVTQAKTAYLQTKINLTDFQNEARIAYADLANQIGLPSTVKFDVEGFPEKVPAHAVLEDVDTLVKKADLQRPDLFALKANVKSYEENLSLAKSNFFPTLDGSFSIGRNYYSYHVHEDYHFTAILELSVPIFYGFKIKNNVKKASANLEKAKAELFQKQLEITKDVSSAYSDIQSSSQNLISSDEYLASAQTQYEIALANYKAGVAPILDLISAQAALADARAKKVYAQKQWFSSVAFLAYATGSLTPSLTDQRKEKL